jgi:hypothetical protein
MRSIPAERALGPTASSSSLDAAERSIDLDRSNHLADSLTNVDVDAVWNAIEEIGLQSSQSQSEDNYAK